MTNHASWVDSANQTHTDFPLQNLPYGVFGSDARIGIAIGDSILDLRACTETGLLHGLSLETARACAADSLNALFALGPDHWSPLRLRVTELLEAASPQRPQVEPLLIPRDSVAMRLPAVIGDYTDFFTSLYHASNVGNLFRPGNPLAPNYKHLPIGYHGRASSIVVSGTPVHRPAGQTQESQFGPTRALDYELEVGMFVGPGNRLGEPVPIGQSRAHIFGLCLLNDWSARDLQAWESQPLGPFLAKSFATSVSSWVVPLEALEHAWVSPPPRDPEPLPYLADAGPQSPQGLDLALEVRLNGHLVARPPYAGTYWTAAQMLAHMTVNGASVRTGDLFASGTVSGPERDQRGCLLELSWGGAEPLTLPDGSVRSFLEDGDEVTISATAPAAGGARIGFGEVTGQIQRAAGSEG